MEIPANHEELASGHARNAIFTFFLVGIGLVLFSSKAHFLSVRAVVFFVGGMFVASLASAHSYFVGLWLADFGAKRLDIRRLPVMARTFHLLALAFDIAVACGLFWVIFHLW